MTSHDYIVINKMGSACQISKDGWKLVEFDKKQRIITSSTKFNRTMKNATFSRRMSQIKSRN